MIKILKCKHCNHEWIRRKETDPKVCPKCKSKNWNKKPQLKYLPKRLKIKGKEEKKLEKNVFFGIKDELNQGSNAIAVLKQRYLLRDQNGNLIETPKQMFRRVAHHIAKADAEYGDNTKKTEKEFYDTFINLEFLPGSPTLMNAGAPLGQLSSCFVLDIKDSLESIFTTLKDSALIMQSGGGIGYNFSNLRPEGDIVRSTAGIASGPTSFARVYDTATEVIRQGGKRRGAMMGILNYDHPDIKEFITAKSKEGLLTNFNLSIATTDEFFNALRKNRNYWLINPRNNKKVEQVNAREIFNLISENAWKNGDPGLIFLDEINRKNQIPALGKIKAVNPCGEIFAYPKESCNLGSINLVKMVKNNEVDWQRLRKVVRISIHFLDNVVDMNKFPLKEIEVMTKANRRIGLGIMSFADLLTKLKIPYNSQEALNLAKKLMSFIHKEAAKASIDLAEKRGYFPNFQKSLLSKKYKKIRNLALTSIAPTGSISILAGSVSSGIEPLFAISFVRNILGKEFLEVNKEFERVAKERGFYSKRLMKKIAKIGSVQNIKEVPDDIKRIFVTALDIKPEWHVRMQAVFQNNGVDNSVSKTVNLPENATVEDVKKIYMLAYKLKCKGITVYRYGSKKEQVLNIGKTLKVHHEYAGGCPYRKCLF